jgi:hypothetical protein
LEERSHSISLSIQKVTSYGNIKAIAQIFYFEAEAIALLKKSALVMKIHKQ